jgi:hypothetical protein
MRIGNVAWPCMVLTYRNNLFLGGGWNRIFPSSRPTHYHLAQERAVTQMRKSKGRRKVGRKKRRMRAKIRHRK